MLKSDRKPGSSFQVSRERQSTDYNKVNDRLEEFVGYFVKEFETKLRAYNLILEGEAEKVGKFSDALSEKIGQGIGGALGGVMGMWVGSPAVGARLGAGAGKAGAEKLGSKIGSEHHKRKAANLVGLVSLFQKDKANFRRVLVKAGFDVFQSFEMQFMRVTTDQGPKKAMQLLARDATNRAINYLGGKEDAFITEAVILGESKIESVMGVPIANSQVKTPGFEINYEYQSSNKKWHTASLYEKVGLIIEGKTPREAANYYEMKGGESRAEKYGYRRLFTSENWDKLKEKYKSPSIVVRKSRQFTDYQYVLSSKDLEQRIKDILEKVNLDDKDLAEERITKIIEEAKSDIMEEIKILKKVSHSCMKDRKILINIATNLKSLKIEEYLERFKQNFEEVKQGQQKIVTSIEASRKENRGNFDQLSQKQDIYHDDDKREHKKTQEGIERVEEGIESHSKKINEIHKSVLTQENKQVKWPIWFDVKKTVTLFAGREGELNDLHKKMQDSSEKVTGISRTVSISGLGGMGKTQLARRYVYDNKNDYDGNVIWIDAQSYQTLAESFSRLAGDRLGIRTTNEYGEYPKGITSIVQEVYELFAERKSLFIFDNAENIEVLRQFLPLTSSDNNKPYVLITSRIARGEWEKSGIEEGITLDEFTEEEAISFVRKALKIDEGDDSQDNEIWELAIDVLYRFPLALDQAVAHIKEESRKSKSRGKGEYTIVKYLEDYKERENELLNSEAFRRLDNDYEKTTLTTWIITTDKIKDDNEHGELALKILDIIAYLAPKNIPIESFFLKLEENEEKLWGAVELLHRYSMVELDSGEADIHQLVQKVMRINSVDEKREEETLRKALKLIKGDNVEKKASSQGSCIFYPCTVDGGLSNIEMHATYIWSYASKYSQLIKDFYSAYGENRNTPINLFAMTGGIEAIKSILQNVEKGELMDKVNDYNQAGYAPIHSAAFNGHKDIVEYFIEKQGVGVNFVTNVHKNTPTFAAVLGNQLHVVEYLVGKKGADPDKGGKYDTYPIHYAALYARKDFIEYLVEKGNADILVHSNEGRTVLHFALLHLKRCREHTSDTEWIVKCLLNKNSDLVKHKDCMGMTALHLAVEFNAGTIITMLLNYGADVNAKSHIAKPRIMDINVTRKEIRQPVDTDGHDKGYTPLHIAADKNLLEAAKLLLKHGAIYSAINDERNTPLDIAELRSDVEKLLTSIGESFKATKGGKKDKLDSLLKGKDYDVLEAILNARNRDEKTLLQVASANKQRDIAELLIQKLEIQSRYLSNISIQSHVTQDKATLTF